MHKKKFFGPGELCKAINLHVEARVGICTKQHQATTSGDNRINLAEERLQWERQQQERNALEKHYNTVSKKKNDGAAEEVDSDNNSGSNSSSDNNECLLLASRSFLPNKTL